MSENKQMARAWDLICERGPKTKALEEEITRLRTALAAAEKERDAAHNDALERAAGRANDVLQEYALQKGYTKTSGGKTAIFYARKVKAAIRALKKGTPNAE